MTNVNRKDLVTGLVFIAFGLSYGTIALQTLPMGRALNMGPGYFPVILSGFMILIGAVIALRSFSGPRDGGFGTVPWRGVVMLTIAMVVFAATLGYLGLFFGIFVLSLLASFASSQVSLTTGLIVSLGIAIFCTVVFGLGVRLPISLSGSLLGNLFGI